LKYYGGYCGSLAFNQTICLTGKWNLWDNIIKFEKLKKQPSLILGALPLNVGVVGYETRNDVKTLIDSGVGAVLSVVEVFENNSPGYMASPVTPEEWKNAGVKQLQLPTPDFDTISHEFIERGVEFIHWNVSHGRSVYIHCKAGRGRSALIVMCYLIKYQGYTALAAFLHVKNKRVQAGFTPLGAKMKTLHEFEQKYLNKNEAICCVDSTFAEEDDFVLVGSSDSDIFGNNR